jgi:cellulose 1,4-beta-cellobiosidase
MLLLHLLRSFSMHLHHVKMLIPIFLAISACGESPKTRQANNNGNSKLASLTIGNFNPGPNNPQWNKVEVKMQGAERSIEKSFVRDAFGAGKAEDLTLRVPFGTYKINTFYFDQSGKLVYQVCPNTRDKEYPINQPKFPVTLPICTEDGKEMAGELVITPNVLSGSNSSGGSDTGSAGNSDSSGNSGSIGNDTAATGGNSSGTGALSGSGSSRNPYAGADLYIDPNYVAGIQTSIEMTRLSDPGLALKMEKVKKYSTAVWMDTISKISTLEPHLKGVRAQQQKTQRPTVTTIVVYDLPGRDCNANASNGELAATTSDFNRYKKEYIDAIGAVLRKFSDLRIAAVIEPDSLPNIVTNLGQKRCTNEVAGFYKEGIAYAIRTLSMPHVSLYLDAAHSGWLGWPENRKKMALVVKDVLTMAGGLDKLRGFATNVANYTPLSFSGNPTWYDPSNPARGELEYVRLLGQDMNNAGIMNTNFIIDTSRNGVVESRRTWGSWCNVEGAGIGERPTVNPASGVDAYIWVKPPGESDGVSVEGAPRIDYSCRNDDSSANIYDAPQAGQWFHRQFSDLVKNAMPAL